MENFKVRDFMNSQPAHVTSNMSIISALRVLLDKKQSAAAVIDDNGYLIGLLSEADCIKGTMMGGFYEQDDATVGEKMSTTVQTVSAETSLIAASDIFLHNNRRVLPVIESNKLVGMLTREHILRALLHEIDNPTHHERSA